MQPKAKLGVWTKLDHTNKVLTMRKIITLTIVAAALAVSACNTIAGAGRDVSAAGSAVTSGANDAKR
jgi:predicted small secreted protein